MNSLAIIALVGNISATKLFSRSRFIPGDIEDDDLVNADKQEQFNKNNAAQNVTQPPTINAQVKSDPIFGSGTDLDALFGKDAPMTPEMKEEMYLRSLKPKTWTLEEDEHPATMDSLAWAEKKLGHTLVIPHIDPVPIEEGSEEHKEIFDYTDDDDVTTTLKSAHQAEMIYGLHNTNRGYGYGGNNGTYGSGEYGWWNKPAGLNGEVEH